MADLPLIQGKKPDSEWEVWVAQALYKFDEPFIFQYYLGTGSTRGDLIIDFLLLRFETPMEVYGEYHHEDELPGGDVFRLVDMRDEFGVDPIVLWDDDCKDYSTVEKFIKREVLV